MSVKFVDLENIWIGHVDEVPDSFIFIFSHSKEEAIMSAIEYYNDVNLLEDGYDNVKVYTPEELINEFGLSVENISYFADYAISSYDNENKEKE